MRSLMLILSIVAGCLGDLSAQGTWTDLRSAFAGSGGQAPQLAGTGTLIGGDPATLALTGATPNAPAVLFISTSSSPTPFKGGILVAFPFVLALPLATDASGEIFVGGRWPTGLPSGANFYFQVAVRDQVTPLVVSLSNGLKASTPVSIPGAVAWWDGTGMVRASQIECFDLLVAHPAHTVGGCPVSHQVTIDPNGLVGEAFYFPVQDSPTCSSITLDNASGIPAGDASRTVEFWVRHDQSPPCVGFHMNGSSGAVLGLFEIILVTNFTGFVSFQTTGAIYTTHVALGDNEWHHLATTYSTPMKDDNGTILTHGVLKMYVDGEEVDMFDESSGVPVPWNGEIDLATGTDSGTIGGVNGTGVLQRGYLDEVTVYNEPLGEDVIKAIFDAGSAGKVKP